jgi:hypothetical protein
MMRLSGNKNIIEKNFNVMEQYQDQQWGRMSKISVYEERRQIAEYKRDRMEEYNIMKKTLLMHKWKIKKKQALNHYLINSHSLNNNIIRTS